MLTPDESIAVLHASSDSAAIVTLLSELGMGDFKNVYTAIVYGYRPMLMWEKLIEDSVYSRNGTARYRTIVSCLSPDEARVFADLARLGEATIPGTDYLCRFSISAIVTGFEAQDAKRPDPRLLESSYWRRRYHSERKSLGGLALSTDNLAAIVDLLPGPLSPRYALCNLEDRLDSLGDVDELWLSPVDAHATRTPTGMHVDLVDRSDSLPLEPRYEIAVSASRWGLTQSAETIFFNESSVDAQLPEHDHISYRIVRDGLLVEEYHGMFCSGIVFNMNVMQGPLAISLDSQGHDIVEVPMAGISQQITVGNPGNLVSTAAAQSLAAVWRQSKEDAPKFHEEVFLDEAAAGRRRGIRYLAALVSEALREDNADAVHLVDHYGFDAHALLRIAAVAAQLPNHKGEVRLLTSNAPPPKPSGPAPDYDAVAREVARRVRAKIRRWVPSRNIHDRYIWIADRIWHVGHSFNSFGTDVSAVVEIRSPVAKASLIAFFKAEFDRKEDATYQ